MDEQERVKKKCWKCTAEKDMLHDFCRDGKDSVCKACRYVMNSEWAKENREKLRPRRAEYMRKYRAQKAEAKKVSQNSMPSDDIVVK